MLWTYLRIMLKLIFRVRLLGRTLTSERIWGHTLSFSEYEAFAVLFEEIYLSGIYTFQAQRADLNIVDCGANIGVSVAYFSTRYPEASILAFEADDETFQILAANSQRNSWTQVKLNLAAVHRNEGVRRFFGYGAGSLVASFRREASGSKPSRVREMPTVRLSKFLEGVVDLLKLDVEGSEIAVVEDLAESGKLQLVDQIIMEYHHHLSPDEDELGRLLSLFEANGFGYELRALTVLPFAARRPQNFMLYAYRKK